MTGQQQAEALRREIWQIANRVRGAVDGWDFKQFVLGALFYRFISENFTSYIEGGDDSINYAGMADADNIAAAADDTKTPIRDELRLYDMRGTAATELLRAGCSLNEIAVTMGWGLRHAANIIEKYAAVIPEVADEVLAKLSAAKKIVAKDGKA